MRKVEVYREPCEIVAEWIEIAHRDGIPLPTPTVATHAADEIG